MSATFVEVRSDEDELMRLNTSHIVQMTFGSFDPEDVGPEDAKGYWLIELTNGQEVTVPSNGAPPF